MGDILFFACDTRKRESKEEKRKKSSNYDSIVHGFCRDASDAM
jgi:hypothetical protein